MAWSLDRLDVEVLSRQWHGWMRVYWRQRLDSVPVELSYEEASALAGWVVKLHEDIEEAVDLALSAPCGTN